MNIKQLIFEHLSKVERERSERIPLKEFAEMVGIEYSYFNHVYNMRRPPTREQVDRLYNFTGDLRFYDVAGMDRPDIELENVKKNWWKLSDYTKERITRLIADDNAEYNTLPKSAPSKKKI